MTSASAQRSLRRHELLRSLRETRVIFMAAGDLVRATKVELGIQMLLDQRVSDRMLDLLSESAAICARDAAEFAPTQR